MSKEEKVVIDVKVGPDKEQLIKRSEEMEKKKGA